MSVIPPWNLDNMSTFIWELECSWRRLLAEGMGIVLPILIREPSSG